MECVPYKANAVYMASISKIAAGAELTFDYGWKRGTKKNNNFKCFCGAQKCKKYLVHS